MIVWLVDAYGLEHRVHGVTDGGEAHALQMAEKALLSVGVSNVFVEQAYAILGIRMLEHGYQRTGEGWHGRIARAGDRITWEPLAAVRERTASAWR